MGYTTTTMGPAGISCVTQRNIPWLVANAGVGTSQINFPPRIPLFIINQLRSRLFIFFNIGFQFTLWNPEVIFDECCSGKIIDISMCLKKTNNETKLYLLVTILNCVTSEALGALNSNWPLCSILQMHKKTFAFSNCQKRLVLYFCQVLSKPL